ncbi:MAG: hypothetical protein JHD15_24210 [Phenylobacterium sp.]|uniref:hypothetical protein n=1 Tax=Phenylobacterium sp. TaxID=1871053 RepID=UPI001A22C2E6
MKGRIKEDDASVPAKDGDWIYWRAFEVGGQYRKWWRRPVKGGPDELILAFADSDPCSSLQEPI